MGSRPPRGLRRPTRTGRPCPDRRRYCVALAAGHAYGPGRLGVDLAAQEGSVVVAAGAGTVRCAGQVAGRGVVVVEHPDSVGAETSRSPWLAEPSVQVVAGRADRAVRPACIGVRQPVACTGEPDGAAVSRTDEPAQNRSAWCACCHGTGAASLMTGRLAPPPRARRIQTGPRGRTAAQAATRSGSRTACRGDSRPQTRGARMRLLEAAAQPIHRDVGVELVSSPDSRAPTALEPPAGRHLRRAVGGRRMAKAVRRHALAAESAGGRSIPHRAGSLADRAGGHAGPAGARGPEAGRPGGAAEFQAVVEAPARRKVRMERCVACRLPITRSSRRPWSRSDGRGRPARPPGYRCRRAVRGSDDHASAAGNRRRSHRWWHRHRRPTAPTAACDADAG